MGEVFSFWEDADFSHGAASHLFCRRDAEKPYVSGDLSPLISRCRDSFPPRGSLPYSVRTWQISVYVVACLCDPLIALLCSAKGLLQKGFPLGGSCRVKRLMRGDKSPLT